MRARNVVHDNLATEACPVWRARYVTPLTPRAVRNEIAAQSMEISEAGRESWIAARLTPLDRLLTEEQFAALEDFVMCEAILNGAARCGDYTGDRVQTARGEMTLLPDSWLAQLVKHASCKKLLCLRVLSVLSMFCKQMEPGGPSDAEAAILMGLPGRDKRSIWHLEVQKAAEALVR